MIDRYQLQSAAARIALERARFGEATVDTVLAVLEEHLAALPHASLESASPGELPGEQRKQVTILFAAIDGLTRLKDAARNTERLKQIDLLWRRLDETIYYHGGIVDKHMGDVVMGVFGVPLARENDPERAVRCGLALRELAGEMLAFAPESDTGELRDPTKGPVIRIGINTGQVSLGQVGSDAGLTVIGDAVNVASRLKEAAAESGIYISYDTYRLVRNLFRVEPLGEVTVKGRQMPLNVYRVVGSQPRLFFAGNEGVEGVSVPMIGRERELTKLRHTLEEAAQAGRGGLITIVGEAGVGKSRLIREFHRRLGEYPFKPTVFQGRTDQRLTQVPYSLLRDLLVRHFGIEENDRAATIEEKIVERMAATLPAAGRRVTRNEDLRGRAAAIGRLAGLGLPATIQVTNPRRGSAGREQAIAVLLEYLEAVAHRSAATLFFLEDIHWADEDSLALLERVAGIAAGAPLLIIGLARPTLFEWRPGWPGECAAPTTTLPLLPLSEADSRELVYTILRKLPQIPAALSDLIVQSAAGNPFYVEELVRVLIEDGIIVPSETTWQVRPRALTRLRVPATLTGVLQARLDRLPEAERVTLQQAAVLGDDFWAGAVLQMNKVARFPLDEGQVEEALNALERRDMIFRAEKPALPNSRAYLFKHAVLREVAYESVLLRDRAAYHLQAARWLEAQRSDRTAEYAAPIAQHYELAGRAAEAARLYEIAAGRANEEFKIGQAIGYYRKVLELLRTMPQYLDTRLTVLDRLGRLLLQRGRLVEALDAYRMMHDGAELDGNLAVQARAENACAAVFLELGDNHQVRLATARAEQLARLSGTDIELVWAYLRQAEVAGRMDDSIAAVDAASKALERGRALDAPRETARALAFLIAHCPVTGETEEAARAHDELLALVEGLINRGRLEDAADALVSLGRARLGAGLHAEAQVLFEQALAHLQRAGDRRAAADTLRWLGMAVCRMGRSDLAIGHLEEAEALAEATGSRYMRLGCRLAMGEALLAQGRYDAAEATLRQVIAAVENRARLGSWAESQHAYALLVEVLNRQGRRDEARLVGQRQRAGA